MRILILILLLNSTSHATLIMGNAESITQTFFWATDGDTLIRKTNMTEKSRVVTGSISINDGTVTYENISWLRPQSHFVGTRLGITVDITVDPITVFQHNSPITIPILSNSNGIITTAGVSSQGDFTHPNISGIWSLTGSQGTVHSGSFDYPVIIQDLQWGEEIESDGLSATVADGMNATGQFSLLERTMFDGVIDGQPVTLRYSGGGNNLIYTSNALTPAIPEPSQVLMLSLLGLGWIVTKIARFLANY